jgi:hypothetical protein
MKITNNGPQSIGQITKHFAHGNLFLSPDEYQRENAWDIHQKKLLIDTIFRGMDVPKFYLWKIDQDLGQRVPGWGDEGTLQGDSREEAQG